MNRPGDGCGHDGPTRVAQGIVPNPSKRHPDGKLIRFWAFRCPGCQETRIHERIPDWRVYERMPQGYAERVFPMVEYLRPVIEMAVQPLPHAESENP